MYNTDGDWRNVYPTKDYTILKDQYSEVFFETVRTGSLKIVVQSQNEFAGGIHEIKIK